MAYLNDCLDQVVKVVQALNLNLNGVIPPVVKRKLPKKDQTLDPPIQITVNAKEYPEKIKNITFANYLIATYKAQVTICSPNDGDELSNIPIYAQWRQQIRQKLQAPPISGVSPSVPPLPVGVFMNVDSVPDVFEDRKAISDLYDYQAIGFDIQVVEQRSA
jgi:hypothetical protein